MSNHEHSSSSYRRVAPRLAAAAGGLAMLLTAGAGVASAGPDFGPAINTTCSYPQVVAAMGAESPDAAAKFNASQMAQGWLQRFLAAPPASPKREQMAAQAQAIAGADQYFDVVTQIAGSCANY